MPLFGEREISGGIYQLLILKTALETIGKKFKIPKVCFSDQEFYDVDCAFLHRRREEHEPHHLYEYEVLPYPEHLRSEDDPLIDTKILEKITDSTFFYGPFIASSGIVKILASKRPSIYLGNDQIFRFMMKPGKSWKDLLEDLEDYLLSHKFQELNEFG